MFSQGRYFLLQAYVFVLPLICHKTVSTISNYGPTNYQLLIYLKVKLLVFFVQFFFFGTSLVKTMIHTLIPYLRKNHNLLLLKFYFIMPNVGKYEKHNVTAFKQFGL